jgi:integrase
LPAGTWALTADETKASRAHLVPLSQPVRAILSAVPQMGPYVFTSDGETHLKDYGKGKQRLDAYIAAAGEPLEPWTLHDLRRSAATHMVRLGVSVEVVGRVLNHAATGVTRKVYALHDFAPEKRSALDRWAAEVERAVSGKPAGKVVKMRADK